MAITVNGKAPTPAQPMPQQPTTIPSAPSFLAQFGTDGAAFTAFADLPLLQSAERAGHIDGALPSSCRNGTCRACLSQLISGSVAYRIEWPGLSQEEKADGLILPCVAFPLSDLVLKPID